MTQVKMMKFKIVCSWCKENMGEKIAPANERPELDVSHGICGKCKKKLEEDI